MNTLVIQIEHTLVIKVLKDYQLPPPGLQEVKNNKKK